MRIYFSKKVVGIVVLLVKNLAIQHPHHLLVLLVPNHVVVDAKELVVEDALVLQPLLLVLLVLILVKEVVIAHVVVAVKEPRNLHLVLLALALVVEIAKTLVPEDAMKLVKATVKQVVILVVTKVAILDVKVLVHHAMVLVLVDV